MRIFQVLEAASNPSVPGSWTWYRNLYEPLVDMGHEVVLFRGEEGRLAMQKRGSRMRDAFSQELLNQFRSESARKPFDLFFAYLMDGMVDPLVIDEIRKTGVPTCNFSCNNIHQFYLVDELSPHFDYNLHSERDAREKFLAIGANPVWFQMAANPKYYYPMDVPCTLDVSFVGMNYALRASYIIHVLDNGIDVHAYGPGWMLSTRGRRIRRWARRNLILIQSLLSPSIKAQVRFSAAAAHVDASRWLAARYSANLHGPVSDEKMVALYSESRISLGFLEVHQGHDPSAPVTQHLHLREFEAPMSGALYFTGYCDELTEFYEPDKEVIVYRNKHELLDKIRYYLAHEDAANNVRQAGHRRALECHTYHKRFRELFTQVGLV